MKSMMAAALSLCLLSAGCSRQQVNSVSLIEYSPGDNEGMLALKTAGNLVPWTVGVTVVSVLFGVLVVTGGGTHGVSGGASSKGVTLINN